MLFPPTEYVRGDPEIHSTAETSQSRHGAGQTDAGKPVLFGNRGPEYLLILLANVAHEIDAPSLLFSFGELQRDHGNNNFGKPAVLGKARFYVPHAIPVEIDVRGISAPPATFTFFTDLLFKFCAKGTGHKHVTGSTILEGVENQLEAGFIE